MDECLKGCLAFVTGGASGIGRGTCRVLAQKGATVIAADKNLEAAKETTDSLPDCNERHLALYIDITDSNSIQEVVNKILDFYKRPPSIIVNCAGIFKLVTITDFCETDFDDVINVNFKGTVLVTQAFIKAMIEHQITNASIINISSIRNTRPLTGALAYGASKAAISIFTKNVALECAKYGIRCNEIAPGLIDTPMVARTNHVPLEQRIQFTSLGRAGTPEEVGETVAFLASDKSSFITGTSIEVSGGIKI